MGRIGKRPVLLMRFVGQEPSGHFLPPVREIPDLGDASVLARGHQHLFERGAFANDPRRQAEHAMEGLVRERHPAVCIELRDADRKLIEHGTLGLAEGAEFARLLLHLLDIDRIACDAIADQRQVGHPQRAALAIDRRGHHALDRLAPLASLLRDLAGAHAVHALDEFDLLPDDRVGAVGPDCGHIGAVDQAQLHIGAAKPHRHRRRFDEAHQSAEILTRTGGLFAQGR